MYRLKTKCMNAKCNLSEVKIIRNRNVLTRMLANITNILAYIQVVLYAKTANTNALIC